MEEDKNVDDEMAENIPKYFWYARNAGTQSLYEDFMDMIKENSEMAYEYILRKENIYCLHRNELSQYGQETSNPVESINALMKKTYHLNNSIRNSDVYNMVYGFIMMSFRLMDEVGSCWIFTTRWRVK